MQSVEAAFEQRDAVAAKFAALFDHRFEQRLHGVAQLAHGHDAGHARATLDGVQVALQPDQRLAFGGALAQLREQAVGMRSEEHTSELQSLMRISYAVFCLKK